MNAKIRIFDSFGGLSSFPAALSGGKKRGKKYPIDWYNNLSSMNTGTANARSKELVNRATVRRKHPVHSCRNRTRAKGRKSKETGRREGGRRRGRGRASAPPRSHACIYTYISIYLRVRRFSTRVHACSCACTQPERRSVRRASTHARESERARTRAHCRLRKPACENWPIRSRGGSRWGSHVVPRRPIKGEALANFESVSRLALMSF